MESLLLGPCLQLAEQRISAIRDGKSVAKYVESLENGTESKETIKPKIDEEVNSAKEAGLNFHVLCFIWLFDVGLAAPENPNLPWKKSPPINVPKFLNRCLGMHLSKQEIVTEHFLKHLEQEISLAKREGNFDQGIKSITGHSVVIQKPRSFCFRGLHAKNEKVLLYKVKVDRGMDSESAFRLYEETRDLENEAANITGTTGQIESGFYIDKRCVGSFRSHRILSLQSRHFRKNANSSSCDTELSSKKCQRCFSSSTKAKQGWSM